MWLPKDIIEAVDHVARLHYVNVNDTKRWNEHRREGELRLLTGWAWTAREGSGHRQGFKTITIAYRDAYYSLVKNRAAPSLSRRPKLRVVARRVA
jgi:hypothetical protein